MAPLATDGAVWPREIRRADQSNLAVVQGISADAYIAAYVPVLGYIPLPAEEDYRPRIERGEVWLLVYGDSDVGVAVLEERHDHLLVYSIAVRPSEQGKGHGRALLEFADQCASALGLAVIRLYTNMRMEKNIGDPRKGPGSSGLFHQLSFVQHYVEDHHFRVGFEIWRRVQQFSYQ